MLFCQSIKITSTGRAGSVVPDFFGLFTKTEQFSAGRLQCCSFTSESLKTSRCQNFQCLPSTTGQYLWAKKARCSGWGRDGSTGASLSGRSRCSSLEPWQGPTLTWEASGLGNLTNLTTTMFKLDMHICTSSLDMDISRCILGQININLHIRADKYQCGKSVNQCYIIGLQNMLQKNFPVCSSFCNWLFLPIQSLTGKTHLYIHQSALAMVGSASGSLCPASPRAAHNLREGWARAAWYFR